ncbi:MAG TPA: hypothetical protein VL475_11605 [Planctomycetaceae bacterium]|nr:hypothetical protein [Planctomycetaceae bacterium]
MSDKERRRPLYWSAIAALALCAGPALYVLSMGPMQMVGMQRSSRTFVDPATGAGWGGVTCYQWVEPWRTVYGPLLWLTRESRIQSLCAPIDWYCNLLPADWIPADPARIELMPRPAGAPLAASTPSLAPAAAVADDESTPSAVAVKYDEPNMSDEPD